MMVKRTRFPVWVRLAHWLNALAVVVISVLVLALAVMAGFVAMFSAIAGP